MQKQDPTTVKDVTVKSNGKGWVVQLGTQTARLSQRECELLFQELLKKLPNIPDGVHLAWKLRHDPWIRLRGFYGVQVLADDTGKRHYDLQVCQWQAEVLYGNTRAYYTKPMETKEAAVALVTGMYGEMLVKEEVVYEASKKIAQNKLTMMQAQDYCDAHGITMQELWQQVSAAKRKGELK